MLSTIVIKRSLSVTIWIFFLIAFLSLIFITEYLPDYFSYSEIYNNDGSYLQTFGRDPGFVFLVKFLNPIFNYQTFRLLNLLFFYIITIFFLKLSQEKYQKQFRLYHALPFLIIIFFKFGIQIREGLALSLWLLCAASGRAEIKKTTFIFVALISSSIHLAVVPYWIALYLMRVNAWLGRYKVSLIFSIFYILVLSIVISASLLQSSDSNNIFISNLTEIDDINFLQLTYWLLFAVIPLHEYIFTNRLKYTTSNPTIGLEFFPLGFIPFYGLLGVAFAVLTAYFTGLFEFIFKETVESVIRVSSLLLMLFCIHLAFSDKRKFFTFALFLFLIVDTIRITFSSFN